MHDQDCICCSKGKAAADAHMNNIIRKHGHGIVATSTYHLKQNIGMAYTLGLYERGLPELLVFAMPPQVAVMLMNKAAELLKQGKLSLETPCAELANLPVAFLEVSPAAAADYVIQANNRAGRQLPVWQMVWTDTLGNFPWDDGFEARFHGKQPLLGVAAAPLLVKNV